MESRLIKLLFTPLETSQLMALKKLLNRNGEQLSTSQVVAMAVKIALGVEQHRQRKNIHPDQLFFTMSVLSILSILDNLMIRQCFKATKNGQLKENIGVNYAVHDRSVILF